MDGYVTVKQYEEEEEEDEGLREEEDEEDEGLSAEEKGKEEEEEGLNAEEKGKEKEEVGGRWRRSAERRRSFPLPTSSSPLSSLLSPLSSLLSPLSSLPPLLRKALRRALKARRFHATLSLFLCCSCAMLSGSPHALPRRALVRVPRSCPCAMLASAFNASKFVSMRPRMVPLCCIRFSILRFSCSPSRSCFALMPCALSSVAARPNVRSNAVAGGCAVSNGQRWPCCLSHPSPHPALTSPATPSVCLG